MISVTRTGSVAAIVADMRVFTGGKVPLVAAKALTFTAQKAQQSILREMGSVFLGGATRYTLGGTRIEPATPDNLAARVAVKDRGTSGTLPEDYLFPSVYAGGRKEKRFERALRASGLLRRGERAMPGQKAKLDRFGNIPASEIRTLLRTVAGQRRTEGKARGYGGRGTKTRSDVFVGTPGRGLPGIYRRRRGGGLDPLMVFVAKAPTYRKRLDFEGIARATALREFEPTFRRLLATAKS